MCVCVCVCVCVVRRIGGGINPATFKYNEGTGGRKRQKCNTDGCIYSLIVFLVEGLCSSGHLIKFVYRTTRKVKLITDFHV